MPIGEFDLIAQHFAGLTPVRDDIRLGIGDDAAIVSVPPGHELAIAVDTMVAGVHFPADTDPRAIGHKALAVNLSDLAAMGAEPAWALLALTLPEADEAWLAAFADGFGRLARESGIALIGGDTTRGPLTITVTVHGHMPDGQALTRSGARPGDAIYVSGGLGAAAAALALREADVDPDALQACRSRLDYPEPRIALGRALRGLASAAIDISDGLLADLGHLCRASGVGAEIDVDAVPRHPELPRLVSNADPAWYDWPLAGGDDYELCFTAPDAAQSRIAAVAESTGIALTRIGSITTGKDLMCRHADGSGFRPGAGGYQHFGP